MEWVYNDGGREKYFKADNVGDCCVRAIANATGLDYLKVYNDLKELNGGKSCRNGTPKKVWKKYMDSLKGWKWIPTMQIGQGCKVHLDEDELPQGTLVVSVSKHLTCVKDGVIHDTYDCSRGGNRCVYGYYIKEQEDIKEVEETKQSNLTKVRTAKGITRQELARESGVSIRMIEKYERFEKDINKAQGMTLYQLAQVLGCNMSDLLEF